VATVLVAVTVVVFGPGELALPEPESARTVREFLVAAQRRDPQRALEVAGVDSPPTGERARFLAPDAMSDQWEIRSIEEAFHFDSAADEREEAQVEVVIAGPDNRTAETSLLLTRNHGDAWSIEDPLVEVSFAAGPLWYLDVNGLRAPVDASTPGQEYALLPGLYRFHAELPEGIEAPFESLLVLPYHLSTPVVGAETAALTAAGEAAVQQAVDAYIDRCVQSTDPQPEGCPFGTDPVTGPRLPVYGHLWDIDGFQWSVVQYPIVAGVASTVGIAITDRQRGVVRLRATGHELDFSGGEETDLGPVDFTVECEMITSRLVAGFTIDGTLTVATAGGRGGFAEGFSWDTC
jgi:hypothetical protein